MGDFLIDKPGASFSLIVYLTGGILHRVLTILAANAFFAWAANRNLLRTWLLELEATGDQVRLVANAREPVPQAAETQRVNRAVVGL